MCEICSEITIKTPERRQWRRSGVFIVNFEQVNADWETKQREALTWCCKVELITLNRNLIKIYCYFGYTFQVTIFREGTSYFVCDKIVYPNQHMYHKCLFYQ